jgi:hypothetical protein
MSLGYFFLIPIVSAMGKILNRLLERVYDLGVRYAGCGIGMGCKAQSAANGLCYWQGLLAPQRFLSTRPPKPAPGS